MSDARFNDRLDTTTALDWRRSIQVFHRAIAWLWPERQLLGLRLGLVTLIFIMGLPIPWFLKILVDHGVTQRPIEGELLYPSFVMPFMEAMAGRPPLEITLYALTALAIIFLLVGYSGNTHLDANLAEGADLATQSENKASAGFSQAHGLVGVIDLAVAIRLSQRITHAVRSRLFDSLSRLYLTDLQLQRAGDAIFRVMHDAPAIAGICHALIVSPWAMVISIVLNLGVLAAVYGSVAPELVWIGFSAVGLTLILTSPLANWMRTTSQAGRASGSAVNDDLEEGLRNVAAVQSLGGTKLERDRFTKASRESFHRSLLLVVVRAVVSWLSENVHLVFQTAGFFVIFTGIIRGDLTLGDTPVILRMYSLLYETSIQFGQLWIDQQDNAAAARRVLVMLDQPGEVQPQGTTQAAFADGIRFEQVSVRYPDGRLALDDISFEIGAGEVVAIAGPTGAGKTTLASLLPRFLSPTSGRVIIGDQDLATVDLKSLRQAISFVFQEHQLLTDTVAANLAIARPGATKSEMREACQLAGALDVVEGLGGGFEGRIGRGGGTLSTGQKQRLSVARALLRDPTLLILDEPTAALDPEAEAALIAGLAARRSDRIVVLIAHRLSTIRRADRILFLEHGHLVESGTHDELMSRQGRYHDFVSIAKEEH